MARTQIGLGPNRVSSLTNLLGLNLFLFLISDGHFTFLFLRYVPSNYVKKEKKSIFDKLLSRKLPFTSNNGSSGGGGNSNNCSPSAPSSTNHHSISPPGRSPTSANGAATGAPISPNHVQVIKYNANKLGTSDNGVLSTNGYSPSSAAVTTTVPSGNKAVVKHKYKALK